jgi:hypothetical protein
VKLNLYNRIDSLIDILKDMRNYMLPIKKITKYFKSIDSIEQLQSFIQERSAHVTQTTLYGYIKTRIGSRYAMMFEDEVFLKSINIAKWNIYLSALTDCTLYTFSYLIDQKNLKKNNAEEIFHSILRSEIENGLEIKLLENAKINFKVRLKNLNWKTYHQDKPFYHSGNALYKWSPIADELKLLDKEIVLNSIKLKWNLVENDFKNLTKDLKFS